MKFAINDIINNSKKYKEIEKKGRNKIQLQILHYMVRFITYFVNINISQVVIFFIASFYKKQYTRKI